MCWIYRLLHLKRYIAKCVYKPILNKRSITLSVVYCPFASKVVRCLLFLTETVKTANSKSFKIAQKTAIEAKGRQYTTGKVI